jgi:hypothetical protein
MELGLFELAFIGVTVISVLGAALTLAWIDASPRKAAGRDHGSD